MTTKVKAILSACILIVICFASVLTGYKRACEDVQRLKANQQVLLSDIDRYKVADGTIVVRTIGRNEPCPCGSGKKVKHCHKETKFYYYHQK